MQYKITKHRYAGINTIISSIILSTPNEINKEEQMQELLSYIKETNKLESYIMITEVNNNCIELYKNDKLIFSFYIEEDTFIEREI